MKYVGSGWLDAQGVFESNSHSPSLNANDRLVGYCQRPLRIGVGDSLLIQSLVIPVFLQQPDLDLGVSKF